MQIATIQEEVNILHRILMHHLDLTENDDWKKVKWADSDANHKQHQNKASSQ